MSLALGHFAVGAAGTTVLLALLPIRVPFERTLVLLGGVWAMVPDIYKLAPTYTEWILVIHDGVAGNFFWFHRILDVIDPSDLNTGVALAVLLWLTATTSLEIISTVRKVREKRRAERNELGQFND